MKNLFFTFFLLLLISTFIFPQNWWQKQFTNVPSNAFVNGFSLVNDTLGWAIWSTCQSDSTQFKNGFLKETRKVTNVGDWVTFRGGEIPETEYGIIVAIDGIDSNTAFLVTESFKKKGEQGIYRTTDGGATWQKHPLAYLDSTSGPGYIHFFDDKNGVVVGEKDTITEGFQIYTTTNAGIDWNEVPQTDIPPLYNGEKIENFPCGEYDDCIWLPSSSSPGHAPRIFKTTDKGYHWTVIEPSGLKENQMISLAFQNQTTGLMVVSSTENSIIKKTTDGGQTWNMPTRKYGCKPNFVSYVPQTLSGYVITGDNNFCAGSGGSAYSLDGGVTWNTIDNGNYMYPSFILPGLGYCSQWGTNNIYGFWGTFTTAVSEKNKHTNINVFSLEQNYPNPFNPETKIRYSISKSDKVLIKVYDGLGKEVRTILNEFQKAGTYEMKFNADNLSSGVYFYNIVVGNYTAVRKMLLIK